MQFCCCDCTRTRLVVTYQLYRRHCPPRARLPEQVSKSSRMAVMVANSEASEWVGADAVTPQGHFVCLHGRKDGRKSQADWRRILHGLLEKFAGHGVLSGAIFLMECDGRA
jgi:hypothetical protein